MATEVDNRASRVNNTVDSGFLRFIIHTETVPGAMMDFAAGGDKGSRHIGRRPLIAIKNWRCTTLTIASCSR
jgi:hypothetical protein